MYLEDAKSMLIFEIEEEADIEVVDFLVLELPKLKIIITAFNPITINKIIKKDVILLPLNTMLTQNYYVSYELRTKR